jgi:hypothetical protein
MFIGRTGRKKERERRDNSMDVYKYERNERECGVY